VGDRDLIVRMTKHADGDTLLQCIRRDGTASWQRQRRAHAAFFPLHDLTHFAIETELGFRHGFYGLIAAGWDIEDTTGKGRRGPLPPEALAVEHLVGAFDLERAGNVSWTTPELNEQARVFAAERGLPPPRPLTDDDLASVRSRLLDLLGTWHTLEPGNTLELWF
jgi:hypothetical protein